MSDYEELIDYVGIGDYSVTFSSFAIAVQLM